MERMNFLFLHITDYHQNIIPVFDVGGAVYGDQAEVDRVPEQAGRLQRKRSVLYSLQRLNRCLLAINS